MYHAKLHVSQTQAQKPLQKSMRQQVCTCDLSQVNKASLLPHTHLVKAVFKYMASANSYPQATIPPVVIA